MRLIDANELINGRPENLNPNMNDEIKSAYNEGWNYCNSFWVNYIKNQPTAYDIDEVVEQLKDLDIENQSCSKCKYRKDCDDMQDKYEPSDNVDLCAELTKLKAIEIVKGR